MQETGQRSWTLAIVQFSLESLGLVHEEWWGGECWWGINKASFPFNPWAHLTPVAYCPVRWTQDVSVAGKETLGLQQVLTVFSRESLLIRAHGLDAQHGSLLLSVGPTSRRTCFPLPCPPPADIHGHVREDTQIHIQFNHWKEKPGAEVQIPEPRGPWRCSSPLGGALFVQSQLRALHSTWRKWILLLNKERKKAPSSQSKNVEV